VGCSYGLHVGGVVPFLKKLGLVRTKLFAALFYRSLGVVFGFLILGFFIVKPAEIRSVEPRSAIFFVAAGFVASFLVQIVFYHGLKIGEVSRVVPVCGGVPANSFSFRGSCFGKEHNNSKSGGNDPYYVWCLASEADTCSMAPADRRRGKQF